MLSNDARSATSGAENVRLRAILWSLIQVVEGFKSVPTPTESKKAPEEVETSRKAFDKLLDEAKIEQMIVLINDLNRCLPDTAIETLEAIRLFVSTSRTAFEVATTETMATPNWCAY